jgi:hypothetical protein
MRIGLAVRPTSLLTFILAASVLSSAAQSAPAHPAAKPVPPHVQKAGPRHSSFLVNRTPRRAQIYYGTAWGVDTLTVKYAESGELIRFNYRVIDPVKAAQLNDKKAKPTLFDYRAGIALEVPTMEKVGQLRQSEKPEAGKVYWMAFSNRGHRVKRGDRVNIEIGKFRAFGLMVE